MAITTAAGAGGGLLAAALRISSEQLLGQAVGDAGRSLAALIGGAGFRITALEGAGGSLSALGGTVDDRTAGLAGLVLLLLLPFGGPVWAGLVPPTAALAAARTGARCAGRAAHARVRVVRNAPAPQAADHGAVPLRILIVDDHDDFRDVARRALAADGLEVVGTAGSCAEALTAVADLRPRVALVDVHLGTESGFELARRIADATAVPAPAVVLMSTRSEEELAPVIARSPAAGFVSKQRLSGDAVRAVLRGGDG